MKTPAEVVKENFWIGAKGGLLDLKHYLKMRESVWLFLYLLRAQTALTPSGEGQVNHGHPLRIADIADEMKGIPASNIRRWMYRLKREGYIRTECHSSQGITFWIAKAKAKTRKVKITQEEARGILNISPQMAECSENIRPEMGECPSIIPPQMGECQNAKTAQAVDNSTVGAIPETATPKGFTPNSPSYYKHTAGAQDAPLPPPSLKETARKLQLPTPKKNRPLQEQIEELKRRGLWDSPGKVLEMQPREAIA